MLERRDPSLSKRLFKCFMLTRECECENSRGMLFCVIEQQGNVSTGCVMGRRSGSNKIEVVSDDDMSYRHEETVSRT